MPSLLRRATCGWRRKVFHCPQLTPIFRNSRSLCIIHSQDSSLMPPKMRKVQIGTWPGLFALPCPSTLEVWPESHWPGFALRQADVLQSHTA